MAHVINSRYELGAELGSGGMGTVYKGVDTATQQIVAIKRLNPNLVQAEMLERFKREGEALRDLNHPNIVKMLDSTTQDGEHYLIMEYVSGGDLSGLLKNQQLSVERCLTLALDLADALTRAHKLDIIHRDLKPANVLIADDGTLRLTDFGVAHIGQKQRVTDSGMIVGTVDYMSPENLGGEAIDARADIWAFGVMLFEMLTGKRPFIGETIIHTIHAIVTEPIPDLEELRPDAPIALIDLIYRMLEKDVNARVRSIRHVGAELEDILQGRNGQASPDSRFDTPIPEVFSRAKHNLPIQTTPFVGRENELSELVKLLDDPKNRLITILAPGGMGKSRLSLEVAERRLSDFDNGVYFVELAPLSDPNAIISAISEAADFQFQQDNRSQKQQLLDFLSQKSMLLMLDNFEHLLDGAPLVTDILNVASNVRILATSRQRLAQSGETLLHLSGMEFPEWETPADALNYAAVKLFMNSAQRAQPAFELTQDNLDYVARICRLTAGMPLGIVLAAAWVAILSPQEIADELHQSMDILADEVGDLPARHQSIRTVFAQSWQTMTESEQQVFMRMSVFRGGFTRNAAQSITGATLRQLMALVNKSLIRRDNNSGRYEIHELLRQFAAEKLENAGHVEDIHTAHSTYYLEAVAERTAHLKDYRQLEALDAIESDFDNIRAAWQFAAKQNNLEILSKAVEALKWFALFRSRHADVSAILDSVVESVMDKTSIAAGRLLLWDAAHNLSTLNESDLEKVKDKLQRAKSILETSGTDYDRWQILSLDGAIQIAQDDYDTAYQSSLEAYQLATDVSNDWMKAYALRQQYYIGTTRSFELITVQDYLRQAEKILTELGELYYRAATYHNLAMMMFSKEDYQAAEHYIHQSLKLRKQLRDSGSMAWSLNMLAEVEMRKGNLDAWNEYQQQAVAIMRQTQDYTGLAIVIPAQATIAIFENNMTKARELADELYQLADKLSEKFRQQMARLFAHTFYFFVGDFTASDKLLKGWASILKRGTWFKTYNVPLMTIARVSWHQQKYEQSAQLFSFILHRPQVLITEKGISERWVSELKEIMIESDFEAAWERGKALDYDTVVQEFIDEYVKE